MDEKNSQIKKKYWSYIVSGFVYAFAQGTKKRLLMNLLF